ncbi:MAG: hypothetical protein ACTSQT_02150, partial [Promethearchaeota archaeon]
MWLVDYARTAFSRSRPTQPERDVFGEIRGDALLGELLIKFFDGRLADKGIERKDLGELLIKFFDGRLADKGIERKDMDEVSVGVASGVLENWTYGGRIPLFLAGFPYEVPAFSIDRQCGSAGSGMHVGIMEIMTGLSKSVLATGFEHMTRVRGKGTEPNTSTANKKSKFYRPDLDLQTVFNMLQTAQKVYEEE